MVLSSFVLRPSSGAETSGAAGALLRGRAAAVAVPAGAVCALRAFYGQDYGLPQHYFLGAPESWAQAFDLLTGGPMRRRIFRAQEPDSVMAVLRLVGQRLLFEFGPIGVPLGLLGSIALLRRARIAGLARRGSFSLRWRTCC